MYQSPMHTIFEGTVGIFFFGTPHGGADPRGVLQHVAQGIATVMGFSANKQVVDTLLPSSERLRELRDEFGPMARQQKWVLFSFQEDHGVKALGGRKVVEDTASCLNDVTIEVTQHIANNHMEMCRFAGLEDVEFKKILKPLALVMKTMMTAKRKELQEYLYLVRFDKIETREKTIKSAHENTCQWLLSKPEYKDWRDSAKITNHHGFLWIKGKPGTGKSTMMKFAHLHAQQTLANTLIISFFFNARGEMLEKSILGMYRSLLFQLLGKAPDLFDSIRPFIPGFSGFEVELVSFAFRSAVTNVGNRSITCFIDALDECEENEVREIVEFFESLGKLTISCGIQFHVCFSSRHYPYVTIDKSIQIILEAQTDHCQDISSYLESKLRAGDSETVKLIKIEILKRASGIFLWVVLVVSLLNKEFFHGGIHRLRRRLEEIPDGLDELFQDILTRDRQNGEELILCLQWILYTRRPLKPEELYFAILSGIEPDMISAWDQQEVTRHDMTRFILSSSKGLAELTRGEEHTVQFIHESVRDFLLAGNGLNKLRPQLNRNFTGLSHDRLKVCCENYTRIGISEVNSWRGPLPPASSKQGTILRDKLSTRLPFLKYAVINVLKHADTADGHGVPQGNFFDLFHVGDWIKLSNVWKTRELYHHTTDASFLYILAEINLPNLIRIQLKRNPNVQIEGERYGFPLNTAVAHGNEKAIKALLTDTPTPESSATQVLSFSDSDINVTIESLINCGSDIVYGYNLLCWAAMRGNEAAVKLIIKTGKFEVDHKTGAGGDLRSPLSWAASGGHTSIIRLLYETGKVDIESIDRQGRTPLSLAAGYGHIEAAKYPVEICHAKVDSVDKLSERTPLCWAAMNGHSSLVGFLCLTGKADVNQKTRGGWTALLLATAKGHVNVVATLLERGNYNLDIDSTLTWRYEDAETPFTFAPGNGWSEFAELLMDTSSVYKHSGKSPGWSALCLAAKKGHEEIVKLLLDTGKVDINLEDIEGQTPLRLASNRSLVGSQRCTPSQLAVVYHHEAVIKLLKEHGAV